MLRIRCLSTRVCVAASALCAMVWFSSAGSSPATDQKPGAAVASAADSAKQDDRGPTPDAALERLMAGNQRYVASKSEHPHDSAERRKELKDTQHPYAIVLACADSRVSPELVFDQGLGDIFVVRVAGNVTDPAITGSVSYAVRHLGAPLIVVVGHQSCGAVKAALLPPADLAKEPQDIQALVQDVLPGIKSVPSQLTGEQRLKAAIAANVRRSINQLGEAPSIKQAVVDHTVKIVGGVYNLESGKVELLP